MACSCSPEELYKPFGISTREDHSWEIQILRATVVVLQGMLIATEPPGLPAL